MGSAISLLWVSQAKTDVLACLRALSPGCPRGESAFRLIEAVGSIQVLAAIGLRSLSRNLSRLPKVTCIPRHVSPSVFNPAMTHGVLLTHGVSLTSPDALSLGLQLEKVLSGVM